VQCALKKALALQAQWKKEIESGVLDGPERVRLRDYARSWLTTKAPLLKPSTRAKYATSLDLHILPALGDYYLDALHSRDVKTWVASQVTKGLAGWTVINNFRCLRTLCRDAIVDLLLTHDPVARVKLPEGKLYDDLDPNLLTADERLRSSRRPAPTSRPGTRSF
jgi:hypothetical protein